MTRDETIREYKTVHQSPELFLELITPHVAFDDMMMYLLKTIVSITQKCNCKKRLPAIFRAVQRLACLEKNTAENP